MFCGYDGSGGLFAKQASQLGIQVKVLGGDGICTNRMADLASEAVNNVVCSQPAVAREKMPGGAAFAARYQHRFGLRMEPSVPFAYDAVNIFVDAMKRSNSTTATGIRDAMQATKHRGIIGEITSTQRAIWSTGQSRSMISKTRSRG